ncbi:collagen-like protein [Streptomyces sp. 1222.5]|uniref:collagen-like protein n=1 Tax=Streptomyces sp. 1222.5 TaxID=1881026 RepID=UPI003D71CBBA
MRRGDLRWAAVAIALGTLLTAIIVGGVWIADQLRTANDARDALAAQVQHLGASPVAGPPGSRGEPGKSVVGPSGPPGPPGPSGAPGSSGRNGRDGKDGSAGKNGAAGQAGASVTGAPGKSGADGASGPMGPAGPQGPAGEDGQDGADGKDGKDGRDGTDGQTCPDGYSLQTSPSDPDALVCRRDGASSPSPDGPTPSPMSLGMAALDPTRRTWI